jgi:hypothetical protein
LRRRVVKKVLLFFSFLLLAGCGGFAGRQSIIIEASDREQVKGCQLLESFQGPSGYRMWGPPMVIGNFKNEAIQKAERIGATHILWRNKVLWSNNSHWSNKVKGLGETAFVDAYKCPVSEGNKEENREEY